MMEPVKILVADDDSHHRMMLETVLNDWGYIPILVADGKEAVEKSRSDAPDIILLDARMPRMDGYKAFALIHEAQPGLPVILMTAYSEISAAVDAIRNGAWDYLTKPLDLNKLKISLRNAAEHLGLMKANVALTQELSAAKTKVLGSSRAIGKMLELVSAVAPTEATCLITGESGTGKELIARLIHKQSRRRDGPFVAINCGALTESLLASELFGHEKGAFTGAAKARTGLFAQARKGVIFLDEIGEMPLSMQVQLLRALQEKEILPVGSSTPQPIDCRILAATNRDLAAEVKAGRFREDLFYRLNVVNVHMPALRERKEDIPLLASHFARRFAAQNDRAFSAITEEALQTLTSWHWPGNVRELENVIERAIILMPGTTIDRRELPDRLLESSTKNVNRSFNATAELDSTYGMPAENGEEWPTLEDMERKIIMETLKRCDNNKTEAAKKLGITRKTLHAKLERYRARDGANQGDS